MFQIVSERVIPFLRQIGGDGSTYSHHMRDARFTIPTPALLAKVVDLLEDMPKEGRDTKGDVYEYMLGDAEVDRLLALIARIRANAVPSDAAA